MPRRRTPPRKQRAASPLPAARRIETGPDGYEYEVRTVAAARATKTYRCPGCDHEIHTGTAHVLVWPADRGEDGVRRPASLAHALLDEPGDAGSHPQVVLTKYALEASQRQ